MVNLMDVSFFSFPALRSQNRALSEVRFCSAQCPQEGFGSVGSSELTADHVTETELYSS